MKLFFGFARGTLDTLAYRHESVIYLSLRLEWAYCHQRAACSSPAHLSGLRDFVSSFKLNVCSFIGLPPHHIFKRDIFTASIWRFEGIWRAAAETIFLKFSLNFNGRKFAHNIFQNIRTFYLCAIVSLVLIQWLTFGGIVNNKEWINQMKKDLYV